MLRRSRRSPISEEQKAKLAERARAQHAKRRGFAIPPHLVESFRREYIRLWFSRKRMKPDLREVAKRVGIVVPLLLLLVLPAAAHHAPSGWQYPGGCCSATDCFEIDGSDVDFTPNGWLIKSTQEVIGFENTQESGDGHWHRCARHPYAAQSLTRTHTGNGRKCLYVPAGEN